MAAESIVQEVNQPLLVNSNDIEKVPELRSISSNDQESESANTLICKVFFTVTIIVFFVACISLIIWITPTPPRVHVHSIQISFSDLILPVWSATFSIENPNDRLYVTYMDPSVLVFHRSKLVWIVKLESFVQKSWEENEIVVKGDETGVVDEVAAREIEKEVAVMGSVVDLDMVFIGRVGFYPVASTLWGEQNMSAVCEDVGAKLSNDDDDKFHGTMRSVVSFESRDCRVRLPVFP